MARQLDKFSVCSQSLVAAWRAHQIIHFMRKLFVFLDHHWLCKAVIVFDIPHVHSCRLHSCLRRGRVQARQIKWVIGILSIADVDDHWRWVHWLATFLQSKSVVQRLKLAGGFGLSTYLFHCVLPHVSDLV